MERPGSSRHQAHGVGERAHSRKSIDKSSSRRGLPAEKRNSIKKSNSRRNSSKNVTAENRDGAKDARNKGNGAFKAGNWQESIKYYSRAIKLDPNDFLCLANRSAAYLRMASFEDALKDAEKCIKIKPAYAKGHVRKAAALHALKRYDEEYKAIQAGLKACPEDETLKQGYEQAKKQKTNNSRASQAARRTEATMEAAHSRGKKAKKSTTVSEFVGETKKILELQMAAIKAQLDMINELMVMTVEEKLDLLFSLMDKDEGGVNTWIIFVSLLVLVFLAYEEQEAYQFSNLYCVQCLDFRP